MLSGPGVTPDFEASDEVLIWMWMFSFCVVEVVGAKSSGWDSRREERPRES